MPVEIKMKTSTAGNNDQFFMQMLPPTAQQDYKTLTSKGISFTLAFYSVTADLSKLGMQNVSVTLPTSTTSLMKGNADGITTNASCMQLIALIDKVKEKVMAVIPAKKPEVTPEPEVLEGEMEQEVEPAPKVWVKKPVLAAKMPMTSGAALTRLSQATEIGQPVRGSSGGSVYYAMALSGRVKLAIRVKKNGSISIRAEGKPNADETMKLVKAGMNKAGDEHWSFHFDTTGVPASRCIGAFLMGLEVPFDAQITSFDQVTVEA